MIAPCYSTRLAHFLSFAVIAPLISSLAPSVYAQETSPGPLGSSVRLTLPAAVDMAIAHNRKLELARLSVQDSEEQRRVAVSHFYPVIQNESKVHHISELEGIVLPAGALSHGTSAGPIPAETLRIDQGGSTSYTSGTGLAQPLTQMFKIRADMRIIDADLRTAKIQATDAENAIALAVRQLYYNYLIEQLSGAAAEDALKASTLTEAENQLAVQEGKLLTDAELGSRADLLEKRREVLVSKLNLDDLVLQLDDLLGLPLGTKLELDPHAPGELPVLPSRTEAIDQVLRKSPTVLAARQGVEKARAGVSAARDAYIPNVTGLARYSYQSGLPFLKHNFGTFGASITYDLFDGGAREANLRDARIKLSMAQTQLVETENVVRIEISSAYDKLEQLQELVKVSQFTLEAREESYRIQSQRAHVDAELASRIATAQAATTSAKLAFLRSEFNLYLVQGDIKRQLGEMPR